ncbi:hypothetical protein ETN89_20860 (plasmid) [Photobacterium damselae subsp. damselae]|uniref:YecA family protein n=1 Tax=Photobacterium damselae TaxID=38293 RepID=UPI000A2FDAEF|nr:SEC-C metal-binding domain-containing protein [Photobacterium damselae]ARR51824.1 hypothetical protein CAY62_20640 [Photobacterium damselae subsp. damselae]QAY37680.1 hypothetical protein ETN89_20860 [Photobacterium damselae subsp. damselae]
MKKRKINKPDENFTYGPLEVLRFGDKLLYKSNWSEEQFHHTQKELASRYEEIVQQIDTLVEGIAKKVSELPAEQMLHRAWTEMFASHIGMKSESEATSEQVHTIRMLEYLQSVIVSIEPNEVVKTEITEEDWEWLACSVEKLFDLINHSYHLSATAKKRLQNPDLNMDEEEFYFKSQMYWCNVRGERYHCHQEEYLNDLLLTHNDALIKNFDISASELITELMKVQYSLTRGMADAFAEFDEFIAKTHEKAEAKIEAGLADDKSVVETWQLVVEENNWQDWCASIMGRLFGLDLFDLSKVTNLPVKFLSVLSFERGEDTDLFSGGEFKGWPLRILPVFKKPFLNINSKYYCFDLNSLFDNIYRVIQRAIISTDPAYKSEWNEKQKKTSEELPFKYFRKLIPNAQEFREVYYRSGVGKKGRMEWCETDGLIIYDDHLFVIEVKAGAFTYTSPANDLPAYLSSIKGLVLNPTLQAKRFVDYLMSESDVTIYDENHKQVATLSKDDFRKITICPITIDSFTEIAAQIQHLKRIGLDVGDFPTWSISVDDLRVYSEVFDNPLIFLHFVEQRMNSFYSKSVETDDELDHLGLYLKHNNYALYADSLMSEQNANIRFNGYRQELDNYFADKLIAPKLPSPITQKMPDRLREIIDILSVEESLGRTKISSYLLDCSSEARLDIVDKIDNVLIQQAKLNRPLPLSTYGDRKLTVFCWQKSLIERDEDFVLNHARAAMLVTNDSERIVVELFYSNENLLEKVDWKVVSLQGLSNLEIERLKTQAESLKGMRHKKIGKIGRNEPCSCGSGKKFKKCCINLSN